MSRFKIKKHVPTVSDMINEAVSFKKEYSKDTYVNDIKQAENIRRGAENKLNTVRDAYQKGKTEFSQVKTAVTNYIDAKIQEDYLSIMNGIFSQSSTDPNIQGQEQSQNNETENKPTNDNGNVVPNQAQKPNQ